MYPATAIRRAAVVNTQNNIISASKICAKTVEDGLNSDDVMCLAEEANSFG
jgi:hypothetical protein